MRIRSIKPEFWSSEDIAALPWDTRLLFIGLWSYVADSGVGRDNSKLIAADLFPLEDDPLETLATVSRGLASLSDAGLITRYRVGTKRFLHITEWSAHQKIDKPTRSPFPAPTCEDAVFDEPSRETRESSPPGARDLGNKGSREQGIKGAVEVPPTADDGKPTSRSLVIVGEVIEPAPEATAQTLVAEWLEHCTTRPPGAVIGQVSKHLKSMLAEGIEPDRLLAALAEWNTKGLHPSTLPSVVHEMANRKARVGGRQQETDDLFERAARRMGVTNGGIL